MPAPTAAPPAHTAVEPVAAQPEPRKPIEIPAVRPSAKAPIEVSAVTPGPSSGVVTPIPGQFYIQVTSVAKPQAEVLAEVLVKRGFKAGDLITGIGGKGGGRPNMAQGSLPDVAMVNDAMGKVAKVVEEKLK